MIIHRENNETEILEAVDRGYHDCYSDMDLSIMVRLSPKNDLGFDFDYDAMADLIILSTFEKEYSNPRWPIEKVNQFWFMQIQALAKLYRKDFLIGNHLANMSLNETLVQQMVIRDIKYGTNHHRYGYEDELGYIKYKNKFPIYTSNECLNLIADKLYCAALSYDELTKSFYSEYKARSPYFFEIWNSYELARLHNDH